MRRATILLMSTFTAFALSTGFAGLHAQPVSALDKSCQGFDCLTNTTNKNEFQAKTGNDKTVDSLAKTITNVFLYLIGAVSVVMVVYGGILYTTSNGDTTKTTNAKNTIMYAVIGLVVALIGYALVNFVITSLQSKPPPTTPTATSKANTTNPAVPGGPSVQPPKVNPGGPSNQ